MAERQGDGRDMRPEYTGAGTRVAQAIEGWRRPLRRHAFRRVTEFGDNAPSSVVREPSMPADRKMKARADSTKLLLTRLLARAEALAERLEAVLPPAPAAVDWRAAIAFRWRRLGARGVLQAITHPHPIRLDDLRDVDEQKERLVANTRQFVAGRPANNALLTGARGSGKSSLVKALLHAFADRGLRMIEVDRHDLADLPELIALVEGRPERFIVFCDDLSFEAGDASFKELKVALDGSLAAPPDNLLIYATSNRRHLMPEFFDENLETQRHGGEIHPGESTEEKTSLSERFGLWLSFYPFDQDAYLDIVGYWLRHFGASPKQVDAARQDALNWALGRGARNGRVAWQFARDWAGSQPAAKARKRR